MKLIAKTLAFVAMLATGAASMGCIILMLDEPSALDYMKD